MLRSIRIVMALAMIGLIANPIPGRTQDFPAKPIRILVGAAPGGLIDLFARTYAGELQKRSGQPVLVENNSVATGTIGADLVAKAAPDGYTLIMGHPANMTIWPIMNPNLPYNPRKDFAPVALVGKAANLLLVPKDSPIPFGQGAHCHREGETRHADLRFARSRQLSAHGDRAVQARDGDRCHPRAVSRVDTGGYRSHRRPGILHDRHRTVQPDSCSGRHASRPRCRI